ncbi:enoyl-CoA hydratase-related protein [Nitrospirillum sp. BR 11828]|uniref:enoyl-CoA hydratase-related protein n=1 Tax=Nitrospirillum sp. BR 11828 TaxID=3104325 RepID=UPI002ACA209E|nr:enoyl-CoA hydratase-related protein [Nitrospirillum sp. BR 11828]MDZ5648929.1 enoyl-CoA hydratase-related protein [Nitrospirillum sp. BR 11828]
MDEGVAGFSLAVNEGVATLTVNRPGKHNALTLDMWLALPELMATVGTDPDVRVVVLTGAGTEAFSAGADIAEFGHVFSTPAGTARFNAAVRSGNVAVERCPKPTIAMIHGLCVGGGCGLALHCDLRFAGAGARFGITPAKLGFVYPFEDTRRLVDHVGPARAKDLLFSGRLIRAEEALAIGLVDRVVENAALADAVNEYAATLCGLSQFSIQAAKRIIQAIQDGATAVTDSGAATFLEEAARNVDFEEGRRAFLAKRRPIFTWRGWGR